MADAGRFWRVHVERRGSDNWGALGVSVDGELAANYSGGGLRFADEKSAKLAEWMVNHYGIRNFPMGATKVVEVPDA